ncbi:hypothetical protein MKEN_00392900 [Mycena kentingensis (nom. inval.)]|nr:hypothetical protein MKEN_00392900 [Mycena kentingensis (nom. inval.)]
MNLPVSASRRHSMPSTTSYHASQSTDVWSWAYGNNKLHHYRDVAAPSYLPSSNLHMASPYSPLFSPIQQAPRRPMYPELNAMAAAAASSKHDQWGPSRMPYDSEWGFPGMSPASLSPESPFGAEDWSNLFVGMPHLDDSSSSTSPATSYLPSPLPFDDMLRLPTCSSPSLSPPPSAAPRSPPSQAQRRERNPPLHFRLRLGQSLLALLRDLHSPLAPRPHHPPSPLQRLRALPPTAQQNAPRGPHRGRPAG